MNHDQGGIVSDMNAPSISKGARHHSTSYATNAYAEALLLPSYGDVGSPSLHGQGFARTEPLQLHTGCRNVTYQQSGLLRYPSRHIAAIPNEGGEEMTRVCFTLILGTVLLAGALSIGMPGTLYTARVINGPVLQATAAAPTPAPGPQTAAPIGEGTQQALVIVGLVVVSGLLIGGGIYLRRRWMATRY
jgi:hypothetical protein